MAGGAPQPLPLRKDVRIPGTRLASSMVGPGGLISLLTASPDQWLYQASLLDPSTGNVTRIPVSFEGEVQAPVWTRDGKLVATGSVLGMSIWRFHPAH
ncbi:MAG: serine/threonine protein kinase [Candidatus Solibacter sp.]|nr:serine/threonine protein kinase [Candidatus Solibacter sp.]